MLTIGGAYIHAVLINACNILFAYDITRQSDTQTHWARRRLAHDTTTVLNGAVWWQPATMMTPLRILGGAYIPCHLLPATWAVITQDTWQTDCGLIS